MSKAYQINSFQDHFKRSVCGHPLLFAGWSTGCFGGCMMPSLPVSGISVSGHLFPVEFSSGCLETPSAVMTNTCIHITHILQQR